MPHSVPLRQQQQIDYIFFALVCVCLLIILAVGVGVLSLQRLLPPADAVLSGPTSDGELMLIIPIILFGCLASFRIAWILGRKIRQRFRLPEMGLLPEGSWAKSADWQSINWRLIAGIAGVVLTLVAAKGFGSYFYVTESGVSVRAPLQLSMRHYEWKDVIIVSVHCQRSIVKRKNRFRYFLVMSDRQIVDLSGAFASVSPRVRAALAVRFAEFIPSHLNMVPGIRYKFDVSEDGLASLSEKRGVALSNALREQVLTHGGILQR